MLEPSFRSVFVHGLSQGPGLGFEFFSFIPRVVTRVLLILALGRGVHVQAKLVEVLQDRPT